MSERPIHRADRGMTLVELLVTVTLLGLVAAVISAAIVVVFRTTDSTEGRLNLARGEQSFTTWMPTDLAAVNLDVAAAPDPDGNDPFQLVSGFVPVDTDPGAQPCGTHFSCPSGFVADGVNQLMVRWRSLTTPGPTTVQTNVSYRLVDTGEGFDLVRYECSGPLGGVGECSSIAVLRDLPADWSMNASAPDFGAEDPEYQNVAGQQVSVTINGGLGPDVDGAAGGSDTITLTAGGVSMDAISATAPTGSPSFIREPSRCGGPIAILVDDSNSIGEDAMAIVRDSVRAFVEAFRETPVQVQLIRFGTTAYVLGNGTTGNGYYDMSESSQVDALKAQITETNLSGNSGSAGGTNWEDAWYRALVNDGKNGHPQVTPNTVVFFTDGVPTYHNDSSGDGLGGTGNTFEHLNFSEAAAIAAPFRRSTPPSIIGVGVNGPDDGLTTPRNWDPPGPNNAVNKTGQQILAQLVDGTDSGVQYNGANSEQANLYLLDGFGGLTDALRTVALKDCGGTLTIRTRLATGGDGQKFGPEVVYENVDETSEGGATRTVATSGAFPTGTFDFELGTASITTSVVPQISSNLSGFRLDRWECRAGPTDLTEAAVDIEGSTDFQGVEVTLGANQAASCTMWIVSK